MSDQFKLDKRLWKKDNERSDWVREEKCKFPRHKNDLFVEISLIYRDNFEDFVHTSFAAIFSGWKMFLLILSITPFLFSKFMGIIWVNNYKLVEVATHWRKVWPVISNLILRCSCLWSLLKFTFCNLTQHKYTTTLLADETFPNR